MTCARVGEAGGDRFGCRPVDARLEQSRTAPGSPRRPVDPRDAAADRRGGDASGSRSRRCGTSSDRARRSRRRSSARSPPGDAVGHRDDRGPRPGGPGGLERRVRRRRPALVRDADHEAARRRIERQLERLGRDRFVARDRRRRAPRSRTASRRMSATPSAACSDVPQPVTTIGAPGSDRPPDRAAPARPPPLPTASCRSRMRAARAGSASIMSVMWNGGPARRSAWRSMPTGRARPGRGASDRRRCPSIGA